MRSAAPVVGKLHDRNYVIVSLTVDESPTKKALDNQVRPSS